jgi:hypothetical protein
MENTTQRAPFWEFMDAMKNLRQLPKWTVEIKMAWIAERNFERSRICGNRDGEPVSTRVNAPKNNDASLIVVAL